MNPSTPNLPSNERAAPLDGATGTMANIVAPIPLHALKPPSILQAIAAPSPRLPPAMSLDISPVSALPGSPSINQLDLNLEAKIKSFSGRIIERHMPGGWSFDNPMDNSVLHPLIPVPKHLVGRKDPRKRRRSDAFRKHVVKIEAWKVGTPYMNEGVPVPGRSLLMAGSAWSMDSDVQVEEPRPMAGEENPGQDQALYHAVPQQTGTSSYATTNSDRYPATPPGLIHNQPTSGGSSNETANYSSGATSEARRAESSQSSEDPRLERTRRNAICIADVSEYASAGYQSFAADNKFRVQQWLTEVQVAQEQEEHGTSPKELIMTDMPCPSSPMQRRYKPLDSDQEIPLTSRLSSMMESTPECATQGAIGLVPVATFRSGSRSSGSC